MSRIIVEDKYYLKGLHEEIGLYDRKLAHLGKYEQFATEAERAAATRKLQLKRDTLCATAKRLAEQGIEFRETDLPFSMNPNAAARVAAPVEGATTEDGETATPVKPLSKPAADGGLSAAMLSWQKDVQAYRARRLSGDRV